MKGRGRKLVAIGFAFVGVLSLVAAMIPAIKGQSLNVTFLGVGVFWLVLSVVVGGKSDGEGGPTSPD